MFKDKTYDLRNEKLKVATFPHIPGTAVTNVKLPLHRASIQSHGDEDNIYFYGIEVEVNFCFLLITLMKKV